MLNPYEDKVVVKHSIRLLTRLSAVMLCFQINIYIPRINSTQASGSQGPHLFTAAVQPGTLECQNHDNRDKGKQNREGGIFSCLLRMETLILFHFSVQN